jgi:hypothetical protein
MSIIREFSKMLSSIPHDQAFTQLLITQILTFYDKCCGWYKGKKPRWHYNYPVISNQEI